MRNASLFALCSSINTEKSIFVSHLLNTCPLWFQFGEPRLQSIDTPMTTLLGSTDIPKHALAHVEAQLPELHTHLSNAAGWCEVFFVPKRRVTPELHAFLKALARQRERGQPIPDALALALPAEAVSPLLQALTSRASLTRWSSIS
ncbi:hypothetical protein [Ktedonospora formicarum]|uniref:Uncharacterized protein n=1 Tax=Ktedonospora formicarum TaxID=2778364 RepID=A0A8J3I508_9CHLR|nr:hypothetical protein [Ktedonospora formicarum]GHO50417.1 hypothetical protein KSX_85800 [Ktedonospora formicarum]